MTKNELMEMARECGCPSWFGVEPFQFLEAFASAILERAAVECERRFMGDLNREDEEVRKCATAIRALKIDNQAQKGQA